MDEPTSRKFEAALDARGSELKIDRATELIWD